MATAIAAPTNLLALFAAVLALALTRTHDARAQAQPAQAPQTSTVDVPGDKPVVVVPGPRGVTRPIVHLHGMCEEPHRNLEAWGGVAREHGTIIALVGDVPCAASGGSAASTSGAPGTKWSDDAKKNDARIEAAIAAVNLARSTSLDAREVLLVGESMGAARAESLARINPQRYSRLVLIGSPRVVAPANVRSARAVANLAGEREPTQNAKQATRALAQAGIASEYFELSGAKHGEYGPDGERIVAEAIRFVTSR
jgi:pimeloyl-ACP methyl ester carboxylesterase